MAVAVSSTRGAARRTNSGNTTTYTSNSQTWSGTSLYLVFISNNVTSGTVGTLTNFASDSPGGVSWTHGASVQWNSNLNRTACYYGFGDGNTNTVTATFGATQQGCSISVIEITSGFNTSAPVLQTATNSGTGTSASATLAAFGDGTNNACILHVSEAGTAAISASGGLTEIEADLTMTLPDQHDADFYQIGSNTSPTATVASSFPWGTIALEIDKTAAGGTPGVLFNLMTPRISSRRVQTQARW